MNFKSPPPAVRWVFGPLAIGLLAATTGGQALAQDAACIVAGRLNDDGRWAPRAQGLTLLDAQGRTVASAQPDALAQVKQVKLARPALLATCAGSGQTLAAGPEAPGARSPVPQLAAGNPPVAVTAVHFPKLRNGQLVELQVDAPPSRVVAR